MLDRLGGRLDRRRVLVYSSLLLAAEIVVSVYLVAASHGWLGKLDAPVTTDFVSFYAAGSLAAAGTPELAYDRQAHFAAEQHAREPGIDYNYFYYPPVFLLLCAALAKLPYLAAFLVFEGLTLAAFVTAVSRIVAGRNPAVLLAVIAFPVTFWNFGWGQNGFLTAALFGAGTVLIERRPVLAGLAFGAVCYKPQFGLLIPVALAARGEWRACAAAAAGVAGLVLLSILVFGIETWRTFLHAAMVESPATYAGGGVKYGAFATPFGAVMLAGGGTTLAYGIQAAATIASAILVAAAWRRPCPAAVRHAVLAAAALIATPLALFYDLPLGAVAVAWLCRTAGGLSPAEQTLVAAAFLALLDPVQIAEAWHLPIVPGVALALFGMVARRAIRA